MQPNDHPIALITGSARRIGAVIAEDLHAAGYNVVIHYHHSATEAKTLCTKLNQQRPHSAITICQDLNEIEALQQLITQTVEHFGRLDLLVNNASQFFPTPVGQTQSHHWQQLMNANVAAPYFLAQAASEALAKSQGSIINIIDVHSQKPLQDYSVYCMSKAALRMMTLALAKELGPDIRVNGISPGNTLWPENENQIDSAKKNELTLSSALKRKVDPHDIAHSILFLDSNSSITGQIINVDCGKVLIY